MRDYIEVSTDEGYFAQDYDQVHCKHGAYIGYPGGPDYMCPYCEDGADTQIKFMVIKVWGIVDGEYHLFGELYTIDGIRDWARLCNSSGPGLEIEFEYGYEYTWIRKEDEEADEDE